MLYYGVGKHGPFLPMRCKRDVMYNLFTMINQSNWMSYENAQPKEQDFFAYDLELGRAFMSVGSTLHSFAFPFTLRVDEHARHAYAYWRCFSIDSAVASLAVSVLQGPTDPFANLSETVLGVAVDYFTDSNIDLNAVVDMLSYLSNLDDGYFRQDCDAEHENGHIHPANHIDLYHADRISLKFGLSEPLTMETLRGLVNKGEPAFYLRSMDASARS